MNTKEPVQKIIDNPIAKTAIADNRQYQITLAELDLFERELAAVEREDPTLHPCLILGRINSFQRTIDRLKQELAEYDRHKMS